MKLSHLNKDGYAKMVDVSDKDSTFRNAKAIAILKMKKETLDKISTGAIKKGDVLAVAQVAGVMGAKKTSDIIPMCHPLLITGVDISFEFDFSQSQLVITSSVSLKGQTGVEMEALSAVSIAALTIYDMVKAIDRELVIKEIKLLEKSGGKSGFYRREEK